MSNRYHWVDYAKAFGILGVVLLHTGVDEFTSRMIRIALIPLFFFLAGLFATSSKYKSFGSFLLIRNGKLLISYLFFNLVTFLFWYYFGRHYGADAAWNIPPSEALQGVLIGTSASLIHHAPLWFLTCLMVVQTAHHIIFYFIENKYMRMVELALLFAASYFFYKLEIKGLPWGVDVAFTMISFYSLGALMKDFLFSRSNWYGGDVKVQVLVSIFSFATTLVIYNLNIEPRVSANYLGNYFLFYIGALAGIFTLISAFKVLERYFGDIKFISYIGENTLIILALHLMAASAVKALVVWGFKLPLSIFDEPGMSYVLTVLSILILVPVMYVINKLLPFTVGRKYGAK